MKQIFLLLSLVYTAAAIVLFHSRNGIDIFPAEYQRDEVIGSIAIGSFNLQVFGKSKLDKPEVMDKILTVLLRYDLVAVQEIRDISGYSLEELARLLQQRDPQIRHTASGHLGRSNSKEQYAFFYRYNRLQPSTTWQFNDTEDWFERPPFVTVFNLVNTVHARSVAYCDVHLKPGSPETKHEMNNLTIVYDQVYHEIGPDAVLFGGDMNADCNYLPASQHSDVLVFTNSSFHMLLPDGEDTTVASSNCAYDRFIVAPGPSSSRENRLTPVFDTESARALNLEEYFQITQEEVKDISDHYPIEFRINFYK